MPGERAGHRQRVEVGAQEVDRRLAQLHVEAAHAEPAAVVGHHGDLAGGARGAVTEREVVQLEIGARAVERLRDHVSVTLPVGKIGLDPPEVAQRDPGRVKREIEEQRVVRPADRLRRQSSGIPAARCCRTRIAGVSPAVRIRPANWVMRELRDRSGRHARR